MPFRWGIPYGNPAPRGPYSLSRNGRTVMTDGGAADKKGWPKWVVVLQAVNVLCALPGGAWMLARGNAGPGVLLLISGLLVLIALVGGVIVSRR